MESGMKQRATCSMQHAEWRVESAECRVQCSAEVSGNFKLVAMVIFIIHTPRGTQR